MEHRDIKTFIDEDSKKIKDIYNAHRAPFLHFGRKYNLTQEALIDIYQDAFVALRKNALQGKLDSVKSSLKTYLFGIGKHLIYNELKRQKKLVPLTDESPEKTEGIEVISLSATPELTEEQRLLQLNFKKLGQKCRHMLTLFYYRGLTIEEITKKEGYAGENVVRSQKSRCLKTLKEYINSPKL
jgi:RNA polymerase sigma factor (sigma-70 family)